MTFGGQEIKFPGDRNEVKTKYSIKTIGIF
jgi:hypothetical protein